jgi:serine phosphatase RsbU (regulator of sigma subunit)
MLPAKEVGGDFYDFFRISDDQIGFAVGDVSGKGVPAAMFMSVSRTVLKTIAREGHPAGEVLRRMNLVLSEDNTEMMFVTVAYGRLHLPTGRLDYATAGHEEAYVVTGGAVQKIAPMGPAVGLFPKARFVARARVLAPGDAVVFATDGITEAFGPGRAMFGNERLESALAELAGSDPSAMVQALAARTAAFAAGEPQSDDLTCLALRYLPASG